MDHFIFIVFDDPHVVGVLDFLAEALNGRRWRTPPHLTIQGPFSEKPTAGDIQSIKDRLNDDALLIANPGIFKTRLGSAVYLRVESPNLKKVWNKPDFPIEKYGFNPHLTLYDGPNIKRVISAHNFLKKNRIELICRNYSVIPYVSKQMDLFPAKGADGDTNAVQKLITLGKVSSSFRAAFMQAISSE
ncbi:2'-5' RNA ligase family protein [Marilutibacter chinensis]|uniref:2'-5' RNA ligase family protein n=1 Tax=Marilutibacter chinensis TaxID=2912247 RepID=A0ABS9HRQ2_9GAMM|nr:2'-5' RNA ligase family protein [Lysobacter chinensis]MCF7220762.1 2'-5' RNA ligase family protein [Lysobacter chinensis]